MSTDGPTDDHPDAVTEGVPDTAVDGNEADAAATSREDDAAATSGEDDADATTGYPPLRLAPGTVFPALLGVVVMVGQALFARTVPQLLYALVGVPVLFAGALARWQVPVWRTRLPVGVQAVLSAVLLLVSIPLVAVDDGVNPLAALWILSFALFPDLLPGRVRTWLETSAR